MSLVICAAHAKPQNAKPHKHLLPHDVLWAGREPTAQHLNKLVLHILGAKRVRKEGGPSALPPRHNYPSWTKSIKLVMQPEMSSASPILYIEHLDKVQPRIPAGLHDEHCQVDMGLLDALQGPELKRNEWQEVFLTT